MLDWMFFNNRELWVHMILSGIFTRMFQVILPGWQIVFVIFLLNVLYRVAESWWDDVEVLYGSMTVFLYYSAGSVIGTTIISGLIAL